jgi:hypothetical protein
VTGTRGIFLMVLMAAALAAPARAQSAADSAAIRTTALDYAEGWYTGDAARMQRALHPDLAKRRVVGVSEEARLDQMDAAELVGATAARSGRSSADGQKDVDILDIFGSAATVRLTMDGWIDYMHMARWQGRWVIVNVLWELKPR